jgi:alanine racemase
VTSRVVPGRAAVAIVDLDAIAHNVGVLARAAAPSIVWVVVKADAYGHGAVEVARAAIDAGASGLCVALVQEGVELRRAGVSAPILLLSEQPLEQSETIVEHDLIPTVCSLDAVTRLVACAREARRETFDVHVKVDTGMHRMGVEPESALTIIEAVAASGVLRLAGLFTHLAVADEPEHPMNAIQLERLDHVVAAAASAGHRPGAVHAANSAATLALPDARRDLVRVGIAVYGIVPGDGVSGLCTDLRPAMRLEARVSRVARVGAGEGVSYGLRHVCPIATTVATVPIGYADGVPRRLYEGGEVLIGGRRRPILGVITMDQLMVGCGDDVVAVGDEVVLLGQQGDEIIRPEDWAGMLGTIGYEIVCGISARIGRRHTRGERTPR